MADETDEGVLTIATQGSITLVGNIFGRGLAFGFVAIVTRLVSPSDYGLFTLGLSVVVFIQGLASLSLYQSIDYFVPKYVYASEYGKAKKALQNALSIGLLFSIFIAGVVVIFRESIAEVFREPQLSALLLIFPLLIPLQTAQRSLDTTFGAIKKMKYRILIRDIINPLTRIAGTVFFIAIGAGITGLIWGYLVGYIVAILGGIVILASRVDWIWDTKTERVSNTSLLSYSLPLIFAGLIYTIVAQIDYFIIGYYLESTDVAHFRVAYLLASNLLIFYMAVTPIFKPLVSEVESDNSLLESRFQLVVRWITMLTVPAVLTIVLAPETYLTLLFTEQYKVGSITLIALAVGYLLNASFGPHRRLLEGIGATRLILINTVLLVAINSLLDFALVPRLGILGAGIGTACAMVFTSMVGVFEIWYLRGITPFSPQTGKIAIVSVLSLLFGIGVVGILPGGIITAIVLPACIIIFFVALLRWIGVFTREDQEIASEIDARIGYSIARFVVGGTNVD